MTKLISKKPDADLAGYKPTLAQLGAVIGTSGRWISELRSRGSIPGNGATLAESVQAWGAHLVSTQAPDEVVDLEAARTRLANAQAEAVERKNAVERGELADRHNMIAAGHTVIAAAIGQLQQVGARVAMGDAKLRKRIEAAIDDVLTDISMTRVIAEADGDFTDQGDDDEAGAPDA